MTGENQDPGDPPEKPPKPKKLQESSFKASQKQLKINELLALKKDPLENAGKHSNPIRVHDAPDAPRKEDDSSSKTKKKNFDRTTCGRVLRNT
ncbi:Hypothetical protein FKW44_022807 [Caligus rogercresseyi]|uniref:Uncharacterized protein n=1 Tax=Caligus rogercresseyi TaxID=217165 RepID=A0A7T8JU85_CALRO|nr:Hypothetical protein FKW44_022807 [Caligus rogercresseyi]